MSCRNLGTSVARCGSQFRNPSHAAPLSTSRQAMVTNQSPWEDPPCAAQRTNILGCPYLPPSREPWPDVVEDFLTLSFLLLLASFAIARVQ
jgi:hypothetical protein